MTNIRLALFVSFMERYALIAISLASNIILARLLTPEEIGVYSVSLAVIGIAQVLRESGISNYLVQEKNLTENHIRTAFAFSLVLGFVLFAIVFLSATFAADFYSEARMVRTLQISAFNFLLLPFSSISRALLWRDMQFKKLMVVNLAATIAGSSTTIYLAFDGFGPDSMAIGAVVLNAMTGICARIVRKNHKILLPSFSEWRVLWKFCAQSSVANIVTTIAMDVNDLVLGKIIGFAPVALVSRAQGLMNLFQRDIMSAVRNVAVPYFSKKVREDVEIEDGYIHAVSLITVVAWPFYGFISLYALEVLRIMFGKQWDEAVVLVPIFCLAGAVAATSNLVLNIILVSGRNDLVTKTELIFQPVRALIIIAAVVIFKTTLACAIAYLMSFVIYSFTVYAVKSKCLVNNYSVLFDTFLKSLRVTFATLLIPATLWSYYKMEFKEVALSSNNILIDIGFVFSEPVPLSVFICSVLFAIFTWCFAVIVFNHPIVNDPVFKRLASKLKFLKEII